MLLILLALLTLVATNPTTAFDEAGIMYLAYKNIVKNGISSFDLKLDDKKYKLEITDRILTQKEFMKKIFDSNNGLVNMLDTYKDINFEAQPDKIQSQFYELEKQNLDKYIELRPVLQKSVDGKPYIICANDEKIEELSFRGLSSHQFNTKVSNVFNFNDGDKVLSDVKQAASMQMCQGIIEKFGDDNDKSLMKNMASSITKNRLEKSINFGEVFGELKDTKKAEILPSDSKEIKARLPTGKTKLYLLKVDKDFELNKDNLVLKESYMNNKLDEKQKELFKKTIDSVSTYNSPDFKNKIETLLSDTSNFKALNSHIAISVATKSITSEKNIPAITDFEVLTPLTIVCDSDKE